MGEPESGFDRDVDRAWREFRGDLADHVASMRDGGGLVLEPLAEESGGPAGPCVQFYAWGDQQVRCEVPSNLHLSDDRYLSPQDEALLLELAGKHRRGIPMHRRTAARLRSGWIFRRRGPTGSRRSRCACCVTCGAFLTRCS